MSDDAPDDRKKLALAVIDAANAYSRAVEAATASGLHVDPQLTWRGLAVVVSDDSVVDGKRSLFFLSNSPGGGGGASLSAKDVAQLFYNGLFDGGPEQMGFKDGGGGGGGAGVASVFLGQGYPGTTTSVDVSKARD